MECRRKAGCTSYPLNGNVAGTRMNGDHGLLEQPAADGPRALEWPALRRDPHAVRVAELQHSEGLTVALVGKPPPVDAANCCDVFALLRHSRAWRAASDASRFQLSIAGNGELDHDTPASLTSHTGRWRPVLVKLILEVPNPRPEVGAVRVEGERPIGARSRGDGLSGKADGVATHASPSRRATEITCKGPAIADIVSLQLVVGQRLTPRRTREPLCPSSYTPCVW
jgi:hypothetical protein